MCVYGCVCMYVCMVVRSVRLFECVHVGAVVPVDGGKRAGSCMRMFMVRALVLGVCAYMCV